MCFSVCVSANVLVIILILKLLKKNVYKSKCVVVQKYVESALERLLIFVFKIVL